MRAPKGYSAPAGARKKEKSYYENTKKPATSFPSFDPYDFMKSDSI